MKKIILIFFITVSSLTGRLQAQVNESDSLALVALYNATEGDNWNNNTGWLVEPVEFWYGIGLTADRVTGISMGGNNNLQGTLPVEISNLTALESINFNGNQLTGTIPSELDNLSNLIFLDLSDNRLPSLPDLVGLNSLTTFDISGNNLTDIPDFNAWSLTSLDISSNNLEFDDLEPYAGMPGIIYSPQLRIPVPSVDVKIGEELNVLAPVGGSANQYQWEKDEQVISGQTTDNLIISNISAADDGHTYQLKVTSPLVSGLTIESEPFTLDVGIGYYWIGNGGNWDDLSHWSTTSGGTADQINLPRTKDNVYFDSNSFTSTGQVVVVPDKGDNSGVQFKDMDWSEVTNMPTFRIRAVTSNWLTSGTEGSIIFAEEMIIDFHHAEFQFVGADDFVLDTKGHYMGEDSFLAFGLPVFNIDNTLSTTTCNIMSDLNNVILYMEKGRVVSNGHDILCQKDLYLWIPGDLVEFDMTGSNIETGQFIKDQTSSVFVDDNAKIKVFESVRGKNMQFNHLIVADTVSLFGPSGTSFQFDTLEIVPGGVLNLHPQHTHLVQELIANGTENKPITIESRISDSTTFISKTSGVVDAYNLIIKDNTALGGATFNAYSSANSGNNTGWNFFNVFPGDSLSAVDFYNTTNGANWNNSDNWLDSNIEAWHGLDITSGRIRGINLPGNNLQGYINNSFGDMDWLGTVDISNNSIDSLAVNFTILDSLESINISGNNLDFADLVNNVSVPGIVYDSQLPQDVRLDSLIYAGNPILLEYKIDGTGNRYSWYKDNLLLTDSIGSNIYIDSISRATMGEYYVEVTNPNVPGLTLNSSNKKIMAVADINGHLNIDSESTPAEKGTVSLLHVQAENGFDTTAVVNVETDGSYKFEKAILWDYVITGFADTVLYPRALPTYYENSVLWEEADTIVLIGNEENLDIVNQFNANKLNGEATISGTFEEELNENSGGRLMFRDRIRRAGLAIRRRVRAGRTQGAAFELVTYVYTNENGEFVVNNLEEGEYRLNFQYPGYPLDTTTDVDIYVGSDYKTNNVRVEALVSENKIKVRRLIVLGSDNIRDIEVKAFPNPTDSHLWVSWPTDKLTESLEATIYNHEGIRVRHQELTLNQNLIDVIDLKPGLYVLSLKSGNGQLAGNIRFVVKYD